MYVKDTPSVIQEENIFHKKLIAIRLANNTKIFAHEFNKTEERISIKRVKYITEYKGETRVQYFDDAMRIHKDAIDVWFILHKGGKKLNIKK